MDLLGHRVTRAGRELTLTGREFRLLEFLLRHAGQVVTRSMLLEAVWDIRFDPQTNLVDVHISRLRKAVDGKSARPRARRPDRARRGLLAGHHESGSVEIMSPGSRPRPP